MWLSTACELRLRLQDCGSLKASGWPEASAEQAGISLTDAVGDTPHESRPGLKDICTTRLASSNWLKKQTKNSLSPEKGFWLTQRHMGLQYVLSVPLPYHSPIKAEAMVSAEEIPLPSSMPCRVRQWLPNRMNGPVSRRGENHIPPAPVSNEGNHIHCK